MAYLRVLLPHRGQKVMDKFADEAAWMVDPGYELWDHLEPGVNINGTNTLHQSFVDILQVPIVKPESQQSETDRVMMISGHLQYTSLKGFTYVFDNYYLYPQIERGTEH